MRRYERDRTKKHHRRQRLFSLAVCVSLYPVQYVSRLAQTEAVCLLKPYAEVINLSPKGPACREAHHECRNSAVERQRETLHTGS